MYTLEQLGWSDYHQTNGTALQNQDLNKPNTYIPARICSVYKNQCHALTQNGEVIVAIPNRFLDRTQGAHPVVVGDWALLEPIPNTDMHRLHQIFPRKTALSRKAPGNRTQEQVIAANLDYICIVMSLDADYSCHRVERYLTLIYESGAQPVVFLTKTDVSPDFMSKVIEVESVAMGVPVHPLSFVTMEGIDSLYPYCRPGNTLCLIGSSGVGKSTLVNYLLGEEKQKTNQIREKDSKGRHTTTQRDLFLLPDGGMIIDNPGIREVQLWAGEDSLQDVFQEIQELADYCKFSDCTHQSEPGCAVIQAVENGDLTQERYENYLKQEKEIQYLKTRQDEQAQANKKQYWKTIAKSRRNINLKHHKRKG